MMFVLYRLRDGVRSVVIERYVREDVIEYAENEFHLSARQIIDLQRESETYLSRIDAAGHTAWDVLSIRLEDR